jgi:hypothetical protein
MFLLPLLPCRAQIVTSPQSGLLNASFEEPETHDAGRPALHWNAWGAGWERVEGWEPVKEGQAMLAYKHWEVTGSDSSGVWQDLSGVAPGDKILFKVPFYPDRPEWGELPRAIELRFETTMQGTQVIVDRVRLESGDWKTGTWNEITLSATAPSGSLRVLILFEPAEGRAGGAVKLDGLVFTSQTQ